MRVAYALNIQSASFMTFVGVKFFFGAKPDLMPVGAFSGGRKFLAATRRSA